VVADIPGLIEGAAEGRGLGHEFLRHVERARVLVLLLDLAAIDERSPEEQARVLLDELGRYRPDLLERPRLVVGTKADVATQPVPDDALPISAVTRQGLDELLGRLGTLVGEARAEEPEPEPFVLLRPAEEGFTVVRDDDGAWRVSGRSAERVVAMADLTNIEAMEYVQHRLRTMGVERALARAGAREGDVVRIGPVELDYVEGIG
jgi:GTP-binding protein